MTLLREYVEHASEAAFATLVARHVNQVYLGAPGAVAGRGDGRFERSGPARGGAALPGRQEHPRGGGGAGRQCKRRAEARGPGAGKAATVFFQTRRHLDGGDSGRRDFGQRGAGGAGGAGHLRHDPGAGQGRGPFPNHPNPHNRSIEEEWDSLKLAGFKMSAPDGLNVASILATDYFKQPVIDETGLAETQDLELHWNGKLKGTEVTEKGIFNHGFRGLHGWEGQSGPNLGLAREEGVGRGAGGRS